MLGPAVTRRTKRTFDTKIDIAPKATCYRRRRRYDSNAVGKSRSWCDVTHGGDNSLVLRGFLRVTRSVSTRKSAQKRLLSHKNNVGDTNSPEVETFHFLRRIAIPTRLADHYAVEWVICPRNYLGFAGLAINFVATVL